MKLFLKILHEFGKERMKPVFASLSSIVAIVALAAGGCALRSAGKRGERNTRLIPKSTTRFFAYPVGQKGIVTEARDAADEWYNAQDLGENDHLGEDWNLNSGGNSDCGEAVYAAAGGLIVLARDAGPGWGKVVIINHRLPDGTPVQTIYGHLQKISRSSGEVTIREEIGTVGNADGKYLCHLHFELRSDSCPLWGKPGSGYGRDQTGWLDPSDFIDKHLKPTLDRESRR